MSSHIVQLCSVLQEAEEPELTDDGESPLVEERGGNSASTGAGASGSSQNQEATPTSQSQMRGGKTPTHASRDVSSVFMGL